MRVSPPTAGLALALVTLTACATRPPTAFEVAPTLGQTPDRVDRDRWECALQAQKETDFDPGTSIWTGTLIGIVAGGAAGAAAGAAVGATQAAAGAGAATGSIVGGLTLGAPLGGHVKYARDLDAARRVFRACLEQRGYALR